MWGIQRGQVSFKALEKLKGFGFGQQEQGGLHSLTWWGFWSEFPTHRSLSDCVFVSSVCLKSAGRKVTPSWSQQVCRSNGGWPDAIANVQAFFLCIHKNNKGECKAIDLVPGHLKKFWWFTPRIPGISRVFQSYTFLGFRDSRVTRRAIHNDAITWNKEEEEEKRQHQKHVLNAIKNHNNHERVPVQSSKSSDNIFTSSRKYEHTINVFQERKTRAIWLPSRLQN